MQKPEIEISSTQDYKAKIEHWKQWFCNFYEYMVSDNVPKKKYIDIKIAAYYPCYSNKRATFSVLTNFRKYFPDSPVYLVCDNPNEDFSDIAKYFNCEYDKHQKSSGDGRTNNFHHWEQSYQWLTDIEKTCNMFETQADWIVYLEDDVNVRDRISKYPDAYLAGPAIPMFNEKALLYLKLTHKDLEINGWSGCGGSIFHIKAFQYCMKNLSNFYYDYVKTLDYRVGLASDALLTYLFNCNCFVCRRWLDISEEHAGVLSPGAAFDHDHKIYYGKEWEDWILKASAQRGPNLKRNFTTKAIESMLKSGR